MRKSKFVRVTVGSLAGAARESGTSPGAGSGTPLSRGRLVDAGSPCR
jgi:hypothetical protein